jgi:phosphoribosylformylglycinamidine synthase PurS subunit
MHFDVLVETSLRAGVSDPQGMTIERSMSALGFEGFAGVRVGKAMRFRVEAADRDEATRRVEDACSRFLTNPVIEDAAITLVEAST